jgi:superfamily II DNA or RNA helicase
MIEFLLYIRVLDLVTKHYNVVKIGVTNCKIERESTYKTGEYIPGHFSHLYKINYNGKREHFDKKLKKLTKKYNRIGINEFDVKGGKEFYDIELIEKLEEYLKKITKYKLLNQNEIDEINRRSRSNVERDNETDSDSDTDTESDTESDSESDSDSNSESDSDSNSETEETKKYIWNEREYQTTIIEYCKESFKLNNKIYIELPTGGGKSYIVYNLFNHLKSNFILIVSPRKIVNKQNIKTKYLSILSDTYEIFNYSYDHNFEDFLRSQTKKIVVCCTQSVNIIYNKLINFNIINILVWFDEAHWAIEDWINEPNKKELLEDNKYIKDRIFTSASPNKSIVNNNNKIFGELYSAIKVKELIRLEWLANIESYIYSENKENINNCKYLLTDFVEKERKFGFSFHNKQQNAFNLFYNHYIEYINDKTIVKPFLLISDFNSDKRLIEIKLDYDFRNIKTFENNPNSIGYVVAQYSMGYDFNNIDFISISDPKLSVKDIIQSIGRGIRPDQLGINGSNKYKKLILSLPIYIEEYNNEENKNSYEVIVKVLEYLIYDIGISIKEIEFKNRYNLHNKREYNQSTKDYDGYNDIKSKILNLFEISRNKISRDTDYGQAIKIIANKNIKWYSLNQYYELCDEDNRLSKNPKELYKGKFTNWIDYLSIKRVYYDLKTCKEKCKEIINKNPELKNYKLNLNYLCEELCKKDNNFPPIGLWVDYYKVSALDEIIRIINKSKTKLLK